MLPFWVTDQMVYVVQFLFVLATVISSVLSLLYCCRTG